MNDLLLPRKIDTGVADDIVVHLNLGQHLHPPMQCNIQANPTLPLTVKKYQQTNIQTNKQTNTLTPARSLLQERPFRSKKALKHKKKQIYNPPPLSPFTRSILVRDK
jgi:hypothetical protein